MATIFDSARHRQHSSAVNFVRLGNKVSGEPGLQTEIGGGMALELGFRWQLARKMRISTDYAYCLYWLA